MNTVEGQVRIRCRRQARSRFLRASGVLTTGTRRQPRRPARRDFKLVAVHGGPWELYDLAQDRTELTDLAAARPALVRELEALYDGWAARSAVKPWTEPQTPIGGRR
jgi:arylsulfatase A-like enzyme